MGLSLKKVRYERQGLIAYVTIDNVEHENVLEEQVDHDLWAVWHDFRDDPKLYVAILTGAGSKSFCAGSDLRDYVKRIAQRSPEWNRRRAYEGPNLGGITKGINVWKPVIAAINGYCSYTCLDRGEARALLRRFHEKADAGRAGTNPTPL